jgi:hypothetical protein
MGVARVEWQDACRRPHRIRFVHASHAPPHLVRGLMT